MTSESLLAKTSDYTKVCCGSPVYRGYYTVIVMPEKTFGWFGISFTLSPERSSSNPVHLCELFSRHFFPPLTMSSLPNHSKLFAGKVGVGTA